MASSVEVTNVLLTVVGFLIVYVLYGIKGEIKDAKTEIKETRASIEAVKDEFRKTTTALEIEVKENRALCMSGHSQD